MAAAVFQSGRWTEPVEFGAIVKVHFGNQAADGLAEKPKLPVSANQQWTRPARLRTPLPVVLHHGEPLFNQDSVLSIGCPDPSLRVRRHLLKFVAAAQFDIVNFLRLPGIDPAAPF